MEAQRQGDEAGAQRDAARQQLADVQAQLGAALQRAATAEAELSTSRREAGEHAPAAEHAFPLMCSVPLVMLLRMHQPCLHHPWRHTCCPFVCSIMHALSVPDLAKGHSAWA
jgi:hypothetical protein